MHSSLEVQSPPVTHDDLAKFREELISEIRAIVAGQVSKPAPATSLLRLPEVMRRTGYGRSSIYQKVAAGEFPPPVDLGGRGIAWREDEIAQWIDDRDPVSPASRGARKPVARAGRETAPSP